MKKITVESIEKTAQENVPFQVYEDKYHMMLIIQLQNKWLETKDGQESAGSEVAKKLVEQNKLKVAGILKELDFLKMIIGTRNIIEAINIPVAPESHESNTKSESI